MSGPLADELAALLGVPREHVIIEASGARFVQDGVVTDGDPFVEVAMFERDERLEDAVARLVTRCVQAAGCPHVDLYLRHLVRRRFYEDGEPL